MNFLLNILFFSAAVFIVANIMPTIRIKNYGTAVVVALVYSVISFLVGWLLTMLAFPFIVITFGLFTFVVNAILLWLTDKFLDDFEIDGFGSTLIVAFLISLINSGLRWLLM